MAKTSPHCEPVFLRMTTVDLKRATHTENSRDSSCGSMSSKDTVMELLHGLYMGVHASMIFCGEQCQEIGMSL